MSFAQQVLFLGGVGALSFASWFATSAKKTLHAELLILLPTSQRGSNDDQHNEALDILYVHAVELYALYKRRSVLLVTRLLREDIT